MTACLRRLVLPEQSVGTVYTASSYPTHDLKPYCDAKGVVKLYAFFVRLEVSVATDPAFLADVGRVESLAMAPPIEDPSILIRFLRNQSSLRELIIKGCGINDEVLAEIGRAKSLKSLYMLSPDISSRGLRQLKGLDLTTLYLAFDDNPKQLLDDSCVDAIVDSLPRVEYLVLYNAQFSDAGLRNLSRLSSIKDLGIQKAPLLTGATLGALGTLQHLSSLGLRNTLLNNNSLLSLPNFEQLELLRLDGNPHINSEILPILENLPSLRILWASGSGIDSLALATFNERISKRKRKRWEVVDHIAYPVDRYPEAVSVDRNPRAEIPKRTTHKGARLR